MFWTEEHDVILVREMLANSPFAGTKRWTVQRGRKWNEISEHLLQVEAPSFKVDQRGVRERYGLLAKAFRRKIKEEERASGISTPELTEVEQALEDLIVREDKNFKLTRQLFKDMFRHNCYCILNFKLLTYSNCKHM